jgi:hypothetical protein
MRTINKEITKMQETSCTVIASTENIVSISENKNIRVVYVVTEYKDSDGNSIGQENTTIAGDDYTLLMQERPSYASQKPLNEYRESDLWYIIDLIRGR